MPKGRKHKKKKINDRATEQSELAAKRAKQKAAFKKNKKYILPLILNTVVFFGLYTYLVNHSKPAMIITLWIYFALTAGFCFAYVIYNRGFSRMNLTPEMLPDSMTAEEKLAFIEDGKVRIEKSKWMLTVIFPLLMTFILDILNMYILEPMLELANSALLAAIVSIVLKA